MNIMVIFLILLSLQTKFNLICTNISIALLKCNFKNIFKPIECLEN
jgi:hypothetical protein